MHALYSLQDLMELATDWSDLACRLSGPPNPGASVVRRAADAITNLAHENVEIKSRVREQGGIPPLVELLQSIDPKVRL